jgi:HK97 family phage portal protein
MFLSNPRADSGDRSSGGDFWFGPVPFRGGTHVTTDHAMQLTAVYACIRNVAEDTSTLPFIVKKVGKDGKKAKLTKHWLYKLLAKRPNKYQNPMEFREMMQGHVELRGNAFAEIFDNSKGEVTDLIPIHPDHVTIELLEAGNWRYAVKDQDGTIRRIPREKMFHLKGLSSNGIVGYNPIQIARGAVATGLAAQEYGHRFFENDARPGGWIEHPKAFASEEQAIKWKDRWQQIFSGRGRHSTAVLEYGMKYHELSVSNDDAQFIETKKYSRSEIASMWRMPPHMIGDLERSTNNNIEHQSLEYVVYSIRPRCIRWEEAIKFSFLDPDDDTIEIEFSVLALLRGDSKSRAEYINKMVQGGVMTRNEGREMEGWNPIDGLDEPLRPLNMVEENEAEDSQSDPATPSKQDKTGEENARFGALAAAAAQRVARKETQMLLSALKAENWPSAVEDAMSKHVPFVAAALGVTEKVANAYIAARGTDAIRQGHEEEDIYAAACTRLTKLALEGVI